MNPSINKQKIKHKYVHWKLRCKYWWFKARDTIKKVFIPLAIFQLVRTLIYPTAFDVFLLLVIFIIIIIILLD